MVMEVWVLAWLLAPLSWLWGVLWYVLLRPWAVAVLIAVVSTAYLVVRHQKSRSQRSKLKRVPAVVTSQSVVTPGVLQVLPVHPNNGWMLTRVSNSLRVFTRPFPSLAPSSLPCAAASILMEVPPKKALSLAVNCKELTCWMEGVLSPPQQIKGDKDGDIIKVTLEYPHKEDSPVTRAVFHTKRRFARFTEQYVPFLSGVVGDPVNLVIETLNRTWHVEEEGQCFVFSLPTEPSTLPYHWSLLVFSTLRENVFSLATLIMLPRSKNTILHTSSQLTSCLSALREHNVLKKRKAYSASQPNNQWPLQNSFLPPNLHLTSKNDQTTTISTTAAPKIPSRPAKQPAKQVKPAQQAAKKEDSRSFDNQAPKRTKKEPQKIRSYAATQYTGSTSSSTPPSSPGPPSPPGNSPNRPPQRVVSQTNSDPALASLDEKYLSLTEQTCQLLVKVANATEEDGWQVIGTTNDVFIMKKPPPKGAPPYNCVKGTGMVRAPPEFVLRFLKDPANTALLDDLLKESKIFHEVSSAIHIVQLLYKAVWPTSPREFSVMSVSGQVDEHTWVQAGLSVQDPRIPEAKGYVRGDLIVGGYVIRSISGKPELSEVTYAVQADMKGSLPSFAVNKITESQPQCVSRLRNLVEPFYTSVKKDPQKLRELEETYEIVQILPGIEQQNSPPLEPELQDQTVSPTPVPDDSSPKSFPSSSSVSEEQIAPEAAELEGGGGGRVEGAWQDNQDSKLDKNPNTLGVVDEVGLEEDFQKDSSGFETPELVEETENATLDMVPGSEQQPISMHFESTTGTRPASDGQDGSATYLDEGGLIIMETLETYTPLELSSAQESEEEGQEEVGEGEMAGDKQGGGGVDEQGGGEEKEEEGKAERGKEAGRNGETKGEEQVRSEGRGEGEEVEVGVEEEEVFVKKRGPSLELKLPPYPREATREDAEDSESDWITKETINYPRSGGGAVDFRTMANQNAAKVLEELFFVSNLDLSDPATFMNQSNGWSFVEVEKDVIILKKKSADSPFHSFMGKGIINLPPQEVYDSLRNPQLRFTYDNMLKELHIVKQIEEGLYILHLHHETTQCFIKQSRDFCILVSERSEPKKMLLVGSSIEVPECPPNPNCVRGKIYCSGWVVEPCRLQGRLRTEITYILQVNMGGVPATLVNFISRRQPLAIAYLRDYLISTSLHVSSKESPYS